MAMLADGNLIPGFVAACRVHLDAIEPDLRVLEAGGAAGAEVINRVFRAVHSIKGSAGFFAFEALRRFSRQLEGVLMRVRDGALAVTSPLMDAIRAGVGHLRAMLDDLEAGDRVHADAELAILRAFQDEGPGAPVVARVGGSRARRFNLASDAVRSALRRGLHLYHARAYLHADVDARWQSPLAFLAGVLAVGECLDAFIDTSAIGDLTSDGDACIIMLFASVLEPELLPGALKLPMAQIEVLNLEGPRGALRDVIPPPPDTFAREPRQP